MVSYLNSAIAAKANGIATTVITATSFTAPVMNAMNAGIPVISYNADGVVNNGVATIGTNRPATWARRSTTPAWRWATGSSP